MASRIKKTRILLIFITLEYFKHMFFNSLVKQAVIHFFNKLLLPHIKNDITDRHLLQVSGSIVSNLPVVTYPQQTCGAFPLNLNEFVLFKITNLVLDIKPIFLNDVVEISPSFDINIIVLAVFLGHGGDRVDKQLVIIT